MGVAKVRRLRVLEEENRELKQMLADPSLDKHMHAGRAAKKDLKPAQLRTHGEVLQVCYGASERRVCRALESQGSTYRYRSVADEQALLRMRIRDLARASHLTGNGGEAYFSLASTL